MLLLLVPACGSEDPAEISLEVLAQEQESWIDDEVVTEGRVVRFRDSDGAYYVLEDDQQNRVALSPGNRAAPHLGESVTVVGVFDIDPDIGRVIRIQRISEEQR